MTRRVDLVERCAMIYRLCLKPTMVLLCLLVAGCGEREALVEPTPKPAVTPHPAIETLGELVRTTADERMASAADLADVRFVLRLDEKMDGAPIINRLEGQFEAWDALPVPGEGEAGSWLLHAPVDALPEIREWLRKEAAGSGFLLSEGAAPPEAENLFIRVQIEEDTR